MNIVEYDNYIQFKRLMEYENICHLFTKKPFNFNNELVGDEKIRKEYNQIYDIFSTRFVRKSPCQCHSDVVKVVTRENITDKFEDCDGLITNLHGVMLVTRVADCQAILLYDPVRGVIGNVHSGWRGTLEEIVIKAIDKMSAHYNSSVSDILIFINPSILKCCFEVGSDVLEKFRSKFSDIDEFVSTVDGSYYIDTVSLNKKLLVKRGILADNIYVTDICTKCNSNKFHSYRSDGDNSGRNIAVIGIK